MWSDSDYDYLSKKGYTNKEIKKIWDRDHKDGNSPVTHKKPVDIVGHLTNTELVKISKMQQMIRKEKSSNK